MHKKTILPKTNSVFHNDCKVLLQNLPDKSVELVYVDPPFNTGKRQEAKKLLCSRINKKQKQAQEKQNLTAYRGFGGHLYCREEVSRIGYDDSNDQYIAWLCEAMKQAHRVLTQNGSLFLHLDYREAHYAKVMLDGVFGRNCFQNEIIWAYDFGGRSKKKWPSKHDNILWYSKNPKKYCFNYEAVDRIPYLAPQLVGAEKAARGKTQTDVWWQTIVHTTGSERTGYPTQKPLAIIERIIRVHSNPSDWVLDFFAGSGTTGEAAVRNNRNFVLGDSSSAAISVMRKRFAKQKVVFETLPVSKSIAKTNAAKDNAAKDNDESLSGKVLKNLVKKLSKKVT